MSEYAELIAEMAGTKPVWITTQQTEEGLVGTGPSGRDTRKRGHITQVNGQAMLFSVLRDRRPPSGRLAATSA